MTSNPALDDARALLAARQHAVVTDLLAGRVPAGFDPVGSALTSDILIGKRASAALRAGPQLGALPQWRRRFAEYGREVAVNGCAHDDVAAFTRWLGTRSDLDGVTRDWLRVERVYIGARRTAWVRYRGRRVLIIGIGSNTWHLAVSRPREDEREGLS
ncbi:hypothetical protein [Williamsia sp. 1135]|uniref:hypothetical protein n=1 Tax=Williamsia sp. 1135 TaxID=1889262 RepID=UPI000A116BFE|nr:hypothetical protein [Williamsia sp. 1135]ORM35844.1 hypothetical protein BFL43_08620 [Williamsia sp. 1135]